jgi:hypothetical protein
MDHIPLHRGSTAQPLHVRYVCRKSYDKGPFLEYPERQGLKGWPVLFPEPDRTLLGNSSASVRIILSRPWAGWWMVIGQCLVVT